MKITVYSLPNCVQCNQTKKLMDREGIEYEAVGLEDHPDKAAEFKAAGLLQAPIVVVGNDGRRWTGFRPDLIKELNGPVER
ncbi:MAG TPA: glutaredoxin domain-containing protein [Arthrobacter sp.]|nr:glutaredoxin domain-containing protein [Arthrobacter sp.]